MSRYIPYCYCTARPHPQQCWNQSYCKVSSWTHTSLSSILIGSAYFAQVTVVPFGHHQPMVHVTIQGNACHATSHNTTVLHIRNPRQSMSLASILIGLAILHNSWLCPLITTSPWFYDGVSRQSLITSSQWFMSVNRSCPGIGLVVIKEL